MINPWSKMRHRSIRRERDARMREIFSKKRKHKYSKKRTRPSYMKEMMRKRKLARAEELRLVKENNQLKRTNEDLHIINVHLLDAGTSTDDEILSLESEVVDVLNPPEIVDIPEEIAFEVQKKSDKLNNDDKLSDGLIKFLGWRDCFPDEEVLGQSIPLAESSDKIIRNTSERENKYGATVLTCPRCQRVYERSKSNEVTFNFGANEIEVDYYCDECWLQFGIELRNNKNEELEIPEGYELLKKYFTPVGDYKWGFLKKIEKKPRTVRQAIKLRTTR